MLLASSSTFGQSVDALQLSKKKSFTEENLFNSDSILIINSRICFDGQEVDDAEYCLRVYFRVRNLEKFKSGSIIDLQDTAIVKTNYTKKGGWIFTNKCRFKGIIKVISITETKIDLDLDFINYADKKYIYKGVRSFKKSNVKL